MTVRRILGDRSFTIQKEIQYNWETEQGSVWEKSKYGHFELLVKVFITGQNPGSDPQFCGCQPKFMVALAGGRIMGGKEASNHLAEQLTFA